eukprot:2635307-Alexandrium_andersonii.AAC.1
MSGKEDLGPATGSRQAPDCKARNKPELHHFCRRSMARRQGEAYFCTSRMPKGRSPLALLG